MTEIAEADQPQEEPSTFKQNARKLKQRIICTDELLKQFDQNAKELIVLKTMLESADAELKNSLFLRQEYQKKIKDISLENQELSTECSTLRSNLESKTSDLAQAKTEVEDLTTRIRSIETLTQQLTHRMQDTTTNETTIQRLKQECTQYKKEISARDTKERNYMKKITLLEKNISDFRIEIRNLKQDLGKSNDKSTFMEVQLLKLEKEKEDIRQEYENKLLELEIEKDMEQDLDLNTKITSDNCTQTETTTESPSPLIQPKSVCEECLNLKQDVQLKNQKYLKLKNETKEKTEQCLKLKQNVEMKDLECLKLKQEVEEKAQECLNLKLDLEVKNKEIVTLNEMQIDLLNKSSISAIPHENSSDRAHEAICKKLREEKSALLELITDLQVQMLHLKKQIPFELPSSMEPATVSTFAVNDNEYNLIPKKESNKKKRLITYNSDTPDQRHKVDPILPKVLKKRKSTPFDISTPCSLDILDAPPISTIKSRRKKSKVTKESSTLNHNQSEDSTLIPLSPNESTPSIPSIQNHMPSESLVVAPLSTPEKPLRLITKPKSSTITIKERVEKIVKDPINAFKNIESILFHTVKKVEHLYGLIENAWNDEELTLSLNACSGELEEYENYGLKAVKMSTGLSKQEKDIIYFIWNVYSRFLEENLLDEFLLLMSSKIVLSYFFTNQKLLGCCVRAFTMLSYLANNMDRCRVLCFDVLRECEPSTSTLMVFSNVSLIWPDILQNSYHLDPRQDKVIYTMQVCLKGIYHELKENPDTSQVVEEQFQSIKKQLAWSDEISNLQHVIIESIQTLESDEFAQLCSNQDNDSMDIVFNVIKNFELAASFANWDEIYKDVIIGKLWPLLSRKSIVSVIIELIGLLSRSRVTDKAEKQGVDYFRNILVGILVDSNREHEIKVKAAESLLVLNHKGSTPSLHSVIDWFHSLNESQIDNLPMYLMQDLSQLQFILYGKPSTMTKC